MKSKHCFFWRAVAGGALSLLFLAGNAGAATSPALFGIYTATLAGSNVRLIVASDTQEMTHPRVAPDRTRITFTRYNTLSASTGSAEESGGYGNTAIMSARVDGTRLATVISPKAGIIAANSSWTDDGKGIFYLSTDNTYRIPQINSIVLKNRLIQRLPTPLNTAVSDPDHVGNLFTFAVKGQSLDALWLMNRDGSALRQVTYPSGFSTTATGPFTLGDYDPRISPDGSKIAFMRYYGDNQWRIHVVDLATGVETDLSTEAGLDGLPDWSSDGKLLLFIHLDPANPEACGVYTMQPDGSNRRKVPLPRGYLPGHARFFPGDGSSASARIIYVARKLQ